MSERKRLSCSNCRKIKRKCDGGEPCSSCAKRNAHCDYNTTDRRSQRFSVGYIKSLETNNDVLEKALAELVSLRDDHHELTAKLASLKVSFPQRVERPENAPGNEDTEEQFEPTESEVFVPPLVTEKSQYYGAGSVFHDGGAPTQVQEPMMADKIESPAQSPHIVTLEEDFDYVANLVRGYFERQYHGTLHSIFDKKRILHELDNRNLSGPFLTPELVYAICANCEQLTYSEADAYCDYVSKDLLSKTTASSVAISQCYTLIAMHCVSKGQASKAWLYFGIGIRVGSDIGFDMYQGDDSCTTTNRCFMGTLIIDQYFSIAYGRRPTVHQNSVPVLRLEGENDEDYLNVKCAVELIEMTRDMVRVTYQPVTFDKDPKVNYVIKFNRSKIYNMKLLKWRQSLDPVVSWSYTSLRAHKDLASGNHLLKFLYFYILVFLNKPFLHVPKQHSTVHLIEEAARESYVIVHQKLLKIEEAFYGQGGEGENLTPTNKFCSASMDICVVILLANVLVTLITSQPEHYIQLENKFKAFANYANHLNLRKYDAVERPMMRLMKKLEVFKKKVKSEGVDEDVSNGSSPPTSDYSEPSSNDTYSRSSKSDNVPNPASVQSNPLQSVPEWTGPDHGWQYLKQEPARGVPIHADMSQFVPQNADLARGLPEQMVTEPPFFDQNPFFAGNNQIPQFGVPSSQIPTPGTSYFTREQPIYNYDALPKTNDPTNRMFNQLFSNTGDEFSLDRDMMNWDGIFRGLNQNP